MIRGLLIFFALAFVIAVGTWTQVLRQENAKLEERVHHLEQRLKEPAAPVPVPIPTPPPPAAGNREALLVELIAEKQRLADLETKLAAQPRNDQLDIANRELARLKPREAALQTQLAQLGDDSKTVIDRSRAYREQQLNNARQAKQQLNDQINALKQQSAELQEQLKSTQANRAAPYRKQALQDMRAQLETVRGQRRGLEDQVRLLDQNLKQTSAAVTNEVNTEQNEVRADRAAAQNELAQVKKDMQHWHDVKNANAGNANQIQLREDIAQAQAKIQALNAQIAALH